ncbi:hypothetical protein XH93_09905 [Bradyrhizobium sp. CCBAU 51753]|nr:hypothetical protein XH93_09905 [Bradyrhizobium sp. CCBAU 51753]
MYWKRLDGSGFKWPPMVAGVMRMNAAQLSALLAGMDWTRMHAASNHAAESACTRIQNLRCIGVRIPR